MNLLLDIDGVLINWDMPLHALEEATGFNDFVKKNADHFNHVSQDQLCLIHDYFGDEIRWLTTWELGPVPLANEKFGSLIGWNAKDSAVTAAVEVAEAAGKDALNHWRPDYSHSLNWWKAGVVSDLLAADHPFVQGKVVWVDDEMDRHWYEIKPMLENYNAFDRFRCIAPYPAWSRKDIQEAYDWAKST